MLCSLPKDSIIGSLLCNRILAANERPYTPLYSIDWYCALCRNSDTDVDGFGRNARQKKFLS